MKPHYKQSADRLKEGSDITAECGAVIPKAVFGFFVDLELNAFSDVTVVSSVSECRLCIEKLHDARQMGTRYVYGILPGQESKQGWF